MLGEAYATYIQVCALALACVVFATAPLVIYLLRSKDITKRDFFIIGAECAWILMANALCALSTVDYYYKRHGHEYGLLLTILTTAFGGTIALGLYEIVLNKRLAIGRLIERRVVGMLTTSSQDFKPTESEDKDDAVR